MACALVVLPLSILAADSFTDVPASNVFHDDIAWLAESGVTKGCNPPSNTRFCPEDNVSRGQMAAFLHRLAKNRVVDAATATEADHAATADRAASAPGTLLAINSLDVSCASLASGDSTYRKVVDIGTFEKSDANSRVVLTFNGRIFVSSFVSGTGAVFELRVDNLPTTVGRASVNLRSAEAGGGGRPVSMTGIFDGLTAGTHVVSVWARTSVGGSASQLMVDPGCWSTDHVIVEEFSSAS